MRIKPIISVFLLTAFLFSCKKDKLEGEYEIFQGEWTWAYSELTIFDPLVQITTYSTIHESQFSDTYEVEFLEKGKVKFIKNDETIDKYRTVIDSYSGSVSSGLTGGNPFIIFLDNEPDNPMIGSISLDTLMFKNDDFPIQYAEQTVTDYSYQHFFVRK